MNIWVLANGERGSVPVRGEVRLVILRTLFRPESIGFGMRLSYTGLAFLISVLLARLLGPAPLGAYYEVFAWIVLISTIVQSGWGGFLVREVAALREAGRFGELRGLTRLAIHLITGVSVAAALALVAISYHTANTETYTLFLVGAPVLLLLSTSTVRQAITRGLGMPLRGSVSENIVRPGLQSIGLVCFALGLFNIPFDPIVAMLVFLAATAVASATAFLLEKDALRHIPRDQPRRLPPRAEWMKPLIRTAMLGWASAFSLQVGTIVLGTTSTNVEIANFRVAQQLSLLLALGLGVVTTLYARDFSRYFIRGDMAAIQRLASKGAAISGATALPLGLIFLFAGSPVISFLYGPAFSPAVLPLAIMTAGQLGNNFFGPVTSICLGTRNDKPALYAHLVSVTANAALCVLLAPVLGAVGAAIAYAISLVGWNAILFVVLRRRLGITCFAGIGLKGRSANKE